MIARGQRRAGAGRSPRAPATGTLAQLLYASFPLFMAHLADPGGRLLEVAAHHRWWAELMVRSKRLVLIAPRSHGKTTTALAFVLWQGWRHGRDPATGRPLAEPAGRYSVTIFSATHPQADHVLSLLRDLVAANAWLFGAPGQNDGPAAARRLARWSQRHIRLANGAEVSTRAYRTSTRGLHPDLLVLDDVLNDANSLAQHQRDLTWKYLVGTLLPMSPGRILIVGSAIHADDLLQRLAPRPGTTSPVHGFEWVRYAAIDEESGTALWPAHHPYAELVAFRDAEPSVFAREYQGVPRDDAASIFAHELTEHAVEAGRDLSFVPSYRREPGELVVLGCDLAVSEAAAADFSVILVAAYNVETGRRRVLAAERHKGLDLGAQVALLVDLCRRYRVDVGVVEANNFQRWILDALRKWPDVREAIRGHATGREKADPVNGVLALKLTLGDGLWIMPSRDEESRRFARIWQSEMAAFGWTDGRLQGLGEHDDCVMATWFLELAIRHVREMLDLRPSVELVPLEDLGIERVRISPDY